MNLTNMWMHFARCYYIFWKNFFWKSLDKHWGIMNLFDFKIVNCCVFLNIGTTSNSCIKRNFLTCTNGNFRSFQTSLFSRITICLKAENVNSFNLLLRNFRIFSKIKMYHLALYNINLQDIENSYQKFDHYSYVNNLVKNNHFVNQ